MANETRLVVADEEFSQRANALHAAARKMKLHLNSLAKIVRDISARKAIDGPEVRKALSDYANDIDQIAANLPESISALGSSTSLFIKDMDRLDNYLE